MTSLTTQTANLRSLHDSPQMTLVIVITCLATVDLAISKPRLSRIFHRLELNPVFLDVVL